MANTFTAKEAKRITEEYFDLESRLAKSVTLFENSKTTIQNAIDQIRWKKTYGILTGIPIDEINRDKLGISVKKLRDHGYETIADVSMTDPRDLAEEINGIGENTAFMIRSVADRIIKETQDTIKLKINFDDQSPEMTDLVSAVYQFMHSYELLLSCKDFVEEYNDYINDHLDAIACRKGFFKWLFTSGEKKEVANASFLALSDLLESDRVAKIRAALDQIDANEHTDPINVWEDFKEHSVDYYTRIEEVDPDILGNGDVLYGLPEYLAEEIQNQELDLTGLRATLRRYQELGVKYIIHQKRVLLGDEMGLGKTVQAIGAMVHLRNEGGTHFIVVCPASVISNWCREVEKHSDLPVTRIHGASRGSAFKRWLEEGGVAVTTYETTEFLHTDHRFDCMVVDEAHYIKNPRAYRSQNVKRLCKNADNLLFMTGTAIENKVDEMISLIQVLQPEVGEQIKKIAFMVSAPQFREKVSPVYYRRKREEVLTELPELIEYEEWCNLNLEERAKYEMAIYAKSFVDARRVSWNVGNPEKSTKGKRLMEIVEEAKSEGRKVIVFSYFLDTIDLVCKLLGKACMPAINGSVTPQKRQEIIDAFDKAPAGSVLPAQIQSGGTGLNIQTASVVIICEPQLKPSIENQAISRAYRMGQARNVLVYRLLAENTLDERIIDLLAEKQEIFNAFADDSVAGVETMELDQTTLKEMMEEERKKLEEGIVQN